MKKILTLFLLSGLLACSTSYAQAQFPYVQLQWAGDSTWNGHCSTNDSVDFMWYGIAVGYNPNDSVNIYINFGDGTDTSYYKSVLQGTTLWDLGYHTYSLPGAYTVQYILTGSNGAADTLTDEVLVATTCGDIEGRVFLDNNGDCIYNTGDTAIRTMVIAYYNGSEIAGAYCDSAGYYFLTVPAGFTYTISLFNTAYTVTCPASGFHTVTSLPASGLDFAIACSQQIDLTGSIGAVGFRNGTNTTIGINAMNKFLSCSNPSATVTVTLDPMLSYVSSTITPVSVTGNAVVFLAGQLSALNNLQFHTALTVLTNVAANVGDTLCVSLRIDPFAGDADTTDNEITVCLPVRNSWDPNEKHEAHVGTTSGIVAPGTELNYTILFQNLGNDDAYEIDVLDEIDANLDLATLRVTGMSHEGNIYITGHTLKFEFNNINLPAASVNEPLSHGWITYSISPLPNLPLGTAVTNSAAIYFDFNPAVITNTVTDIFDLTTGLDEAITADKISLYPNPANDYFTIALDEIEEITISVFDLSGRKALSDIKVLAGDKISTRGLKPGLYQVMVTTSDKIYSGKITVN